MTVSFDRPNLTVNVEWEIGRTVWEPPVRVDYATILTDIPWADGHPDEEGWEKGSEHGWEHADDLYTNPDYS